MTYQINTSYKVLIQNRMENNQINIDKIIERLVAVRGSKPGKTVNLSEQ